MQEQSVYFVGRGPASKSLLLRALIIKSYFPHFQIIGDSPCDDVQLMQRFLSKFRALGLDKGGVRGSASSVDMSAGLSGVQVTGWDKKSPIVFDCSASGAGLRFLALRLSRVGGHFVLKGQARLFKRPITELCSLLNQLSCEVEVGPYSLTIKSEGWRTTGASLVLSPPPITKFKSKNKCLKGAMPPDINLGDDGHRGVKCQTQSLRSSQFASAVLLNSWSLLSPLRFSIEGAMYSYSYFQMTLDLLKSLGMTIYLSQNGASKEYYIPPKQSVGQTGQLVSSPIVQYEPEQDMSSLFALAAMTVCKLVPRPARVAGTVIFSDWPKVSLQPDAIFPDLLKKMGFYVHLSHKRRLKITAPPDIKPITCNIKDTPDLFPVLASLCALSRGVSHLYGAPHLVYKESDRLKQVANLLKQVGKTVKVLKDGVMISGPVKVCQPFNFDPAGDHRMAMAGGVLKKAGFPIRILHPEVVNKSFPDFWSITSP